MKRLFIIMALSVGFLSGAVLPQYSMAIAQAKEVKKGKLKPKKKIKHVKRIHKRKKTAKQEPTDKVSKD